MLKFDHAPHKARNLSLDFKVLQAAVTPALGAVPASALNGPLSNLRSQQLADQDTLHTLFGSH